MVQSSNLLIWNIKSTRLYWMWSLTFLSSKLSSFSCTFCLSPLLYIPFFLFFCLLIIFFYSFFSLLSWKSYIYILNIPSVVTIQLVVCIPDHGPLDVLFLFIPHDSFIVFMHFKSLHDYSQVILTTVFIFS